MLFDIISHYCYCNFVACINNLRLVIKHEYYMITFFTSPIRTTLIISLVNVKSNTLKPRTWTNEGG